MTSQGLTAQESPPQRMTAGICWVAQSDGPTTATLLFVPPQG